ncbi:MAG: hypothetical protein VZR95_00750 [Alphaproteobacteria bacterium]
MINKKKILHICLLLAAVCIFVLLFGFPDALADENCTPGAATDVDVTQANSNGMFDNSILQDMQNMMRKVYKALSMLFMMGHGLMCYAIKVAYICIGVEPLFCVAKLPNLNFLISGLVIYITAGLMCMSIGMYFVDISFKLGFAVLFIPVSVGLWPFKPTHGKFAENLSIVIRNGMLFMLVAIGVSYAVILIVDGAFASTSGEATGWEGFWKAIAEKKTAMLVKNFSLDSMHILLVGFCIIFGFKILASSVNDYLNYFFQDAAFKKESPMHHVGTQAVGMATNAAVKPALSFAQDVATHQAGRAIAGAGAGIAKLGSAEGRAQLKAGAQRIAANAQHTFNSAQLAVAKGIQSAAHPVDTYNKAMGAAGKVANKGIQKLGGAAKSVADTAFLFAPKIPLVTLVDKDGKFNPKSNIVLQKIDPSKKFSLKNLRVAYRHSGETFNDRRENFNKFLNRADSKIQALGQGAENVLAHGGGKLLPKEKREQFVEKAKQKIASGGAAMMNGMRTMSAPTGANPDQPNRPTQQVTADQVRQTLHNTKEGIKGVSADLMEKTKQTIAAGGAKVYNGGATVVNGAKRMASAVGINTTPTQKVSTDQARQVLHNMTDVNHLEAKTKASGEKLAAAKENYQNAAQNFEKAEKAARATGGATYDKDGNLQSKGIIDDAATAAFNVVKEPARFAAVVLKPAARLVIGTAGAVTGHDTGVKAGIIGDFKNFADTSVTYKSVKATCRAIKAIPDAPEKIKTAAVNGIGKVAEKYENLEAQRAQSNAQRVAEGKSEEGRTKFYIKKSGAAAGKVVARGAKNTAEGSAKLVGNLLQGFGQALGDNRRPKQEKPKSLMARMREKSAMEEYYEEQERKRIEDAENASYFSTLSDKYDNE